MKHVGFTSVLVFIVFGLCTDVVAWKPAINRSGEVIQRGNMLKITCSGRGEIEFTTQTRAGNIAGSKPEIALIAKNSTTYTYTLTIKNAGEVDTGWYACAKKGITVKNNDQIIEHSSEVVAWTYVYVNSLNPFSVMPGNYFPYVLVTTGDRAVIPCRPTSPKLDVILMKNFVEEIENAQWDPKIGFIIENTTGSDAGSFNCITDLGESPEYQLHVEGTHPLSRSDVKIDENRRVVLGENATLCCNITVPARTHISMNWTRPNSVSTERLIDSPRQLENGTEETHILNLTILNVEEKDAGEYICIVSGTNDIISSSTNVTVLDPKKPFLTSYVIGNKTSISKLENEIATWQIEIDTNPDATVKWYKEGNLIENVGSDESSKYSRISDMTKVTFTISQLNTSDIGNYTIHISTLYESANITLQLRVLVKPVARIQNVSSYYKPEEDAVFYCNATGLPTPNVTWSFLEWRSEKDPPTVISSNHTKKPVNSGAFSLSSELNMRMNVTGNLTCKTCNEVDCTEATEPIFISDGVGSFGIIDPGEVIDGDNVTLICAASVFNYTDKIEWKSKGSAKLDHISERIEIESTMTNFTSQSMLKIRGVERKDSGNYLCEAENEAGGIDTRVHNLTVLDAFAPVVESNMKKSKIHVDLQKHKIVTKNLTCFAKGRPKPEVTWMKNGKRISPDDDQIKISPDNSWIYIGYFVKGETRNYSCIAKNRLGSVETYDVIRVEGESDKTAVWISLICVLIVIIIIVITYMGLKLQRERRDKRVLCEAGLTHFENGALECLNPDLTVDDQAELLPYDKKWEFPRELLKLGKQLGSGAFGVVVKAEARGICVEGEVTTVAVKMVRRSADPSYMKALSSELKIMIYLGRHINVVNLLGACTKTILTKRELYVIVEYCRYGNLHNYLQRHRDSFIDQIDPSTQKIDPNIGIEHLVRSDSVVSQNRYRHIGSSIYRSISSTSHDSNSGGELIDYRLQGTDSGDVNTSPDGGVLSNNSVQPGWRSNYRGDYRDQNLVPICTKDLLCWAWQISCGMEYLSSRNIMHGDLAARNILLADDNIVKICDFGLAKNMYKDNNYKKKGDGPLPIKWMAIESIRDHIFSTQSDVWSFGIVLWEFFTLARTPYPGIEAEKQFEKLIEGYRMEKPKYATQEIYEFMLQCWKAKPSSRPTFTELVDKIGALLNEGTKMHYLELNSPNIDMNTLALQSGQSDYLTMMSAPNHDYRNLSDPELQKSPNSSYIPMSPVVKSDETTIFSPRPELGETHFECPPTDGNIPSNTDSADCIEAVAKLGIGNFDEKPNDVQLDRIDLQNKDNSQTPIESESPCPTALTNNRHYINLNQPSDKLIDSKQNLNEMNAQKNNEELFSLVTPAQNNYVNMPQKKIPPLKDRVDSFNNPSYVIMTK